MSKIHKLLSLHEGRVPYAYQDSLGYWTIGVGHLIDRAKGGRLPEDIIDLLLDHDIEEHSEALYRALPWVMELDEVRRSVLIDMAFNLGVAGLLKFKRTLKAVQDRDYTPASVYMLQSLWARQVGSRSKRLSLMMRTGQWPKEVL